MVWLRRLGMKTHREKLVDLVAVTGLFHEIFKIQLSCQFAR